MNFYPTPGKGDETPQQPVQPPPQAAPATAPPPARVQPPAYNCEPVNPNATPEARPLLKKLCDLSGKGILTGQHNLSDRYYHEILTIANGKPIALGELGAPPSAEVTRLVPGSQGGRIDETQRIRHDDRMWTRSVLHHRRRAAKSRRCETG